LERATRLSSRVSTVRRQYTVLRRTVQVQSEPMRRFLHRCCVMSRHAASRQRRLLGLYLPWLILATGLVGLFLLISRPRQIPERPAPPPHKSLPYRPPVIPALPDTGVSGAAATAKTWILPPPPRTQPTAPRFEERVSSDSSRIPLTVPLSMPPLDTIAPLAPLRPIP
jgi:hypothetical protein